MFQFRFLVEETVHAAVTIVSTSGEVSLFTILQVYWRHNAELLNLEKQVTVTCVFFFFTFC